MATSENVKNAVMQKLFGIAEFSVRPMMGEYLLYMNEKLVGGIYDGFLLIKVTKSNAELLTAPEFLVPYPGAKPMLHLNINESKALIAQVLQKTYSELSERKPKKR